MKQLPEKWAIKAKKLHNDFIIWFNNQPNVNKGAYYPYTNKQDYFLHYPAYHDGDCFAKYSGIHEGYEEITIEQWREALIEEYRKSLDHDTDSILPEDESKAKFIQETGELIGYEAPMDIPKWNTKKGDLWTYTKNGWYEFENEALPAEWVETWKPRYKSKEKKRVPKSGWVIQVVGGLGIPILDGSTSRPALFNTQADCIEWVKNNGMLDEFYTFLEVDYITEE